MNAFRRSHRRTRRLSLENIEARRMLAAFNMPWPEPDTISVSFLPDGSEVGAARSELFELLDAQLPREVWQQTILKAFQTWATRSNLNITLVSDDGSPVGIVGFKQGDPRFGDVRIGAFDMAADVLAVANPYDPFVANTWVGDIFLNSSSRTSLDTADHPSAIADRAERLFQIALHEAGHVLGLGHSDDPTSPMFPRFRETGSVLPTAADLASLATLFGSTRDDPWEGAAGNNRQVTATPLVLESAEGDAYPAQVRGALSSGDDVDWFRVEVPPGTHEIDLQRHVAEASLLTARVRVLDAAGRVVAETQTMDPTRNDLTLPIDQFAPGETYYVAIDASRDDEFGIGAYDLVLAPRGAEPAEPPADDPAIPPIGSVLLATTPGYVEHTYYEAVATLDALRPAVSYRMRSADLGPDLRNVFTVVVEAYGNTSPLTITISDDEGRPVSGKLLRNEASLWQIQVDNVGSNVDYFVEVAADVSQGAVEIEVETDFALDGTHQQTFVSDGLAPSESEVIRTLLVDQSQQFHLTLGGSDFSQPARTGLTMTIENARGRVVFQSTVDDGAVRTADVFLDQGVYLFRFARTNDTSLPVSFLLTGASQSSPIGPMLRDSTLEPVIAESESTLAQLSYFWLPGRAIETTLAGAASDSLRTSVVLSAAAGAASGSARPGAEASGVLPPIATASIGGRATLSDARTGEATPSLASSATVGALRALDRLMAAMASVEPDNRADEASGDALFQPSTPLGPHVDRANAIPAAKPRRASPAEQSAPRRSSRETEVAPAQPPVDSDESTPAGDAEPADQSQNDLPQQPRRWHEWLLVWSSLLFGALIPIRNQPRENRQRVRRIVRDRLVD